MCEQLAQGCYAALPESELNPRPVDRKSNALSVAPPVGWLNFERKKNQIFKLQILLTGSDSFNIRHYHYDDQLAKII